MSEPTIGKSSNEITKQINIPLFECCLAMGIAQKTVDGLIKRADTNEFARELKVLDEWLATCSQRLSKLTEMLDTVFDSNREGPNQNRE